MNTTLLYSPTLRNELMIPDTLRNSQWKELLFLCILVTLIICGNMIVILAIALSKKGLKSRMNYFILHLAFADLSVGFFSVLPDIYMRLKSLGELGSFACGLVHYVQCLAMFASTYVLVCMTIDRCDAILRPLNFSSNELRSRILVTLAWSISFVFSLPTAFINENAVEYIDGREVIGDVMFCDEEFNNYEGAGQLQPSSYCGSAAHTGSSLATRAHPRQPTQFPAGAVEQSQIGYSSQIAEQIAEYSGGSGARYMDYEDARTTFPQHRREIAANCGAIQQGPVGGVRVRPTVHQQDGSSLRPILIDCDSDDGTDACLDHHVIPEQTPESQPIRHAYRTSVNSGGVVESFDPNTGGTMRITTNQHVEGFVCEGGGMLFRGIHTDNNVAIGDDGLRYVLFQNGDGRMTYDLYDNVYGVQDKRYYLTQ